MQKIRYGLIVLWMLLCSVTSAEAQVSIGIGFPNVSIGINLPLFPELVPVPGYPVYYAPRVNANYFFYDGMYWVYQNDYWYASSWYNGPWGLVQPEYVPLFILRIPVRYYRQPPVYFRGWQSNAPPRWGEHWGHNWEQRRSGWDRWNRSSAPAPAPLPVYQRQYSGDRYPRRVEQQQTLRSQNYRYQPRDTIVRQHFQQQLEQRAPAPAQRGRQEAPVKKSTPIQTPPQQRAPALNEQRQQPGASQAPAPAQRERREAPLKRSAPVQTPPQQRAPALKDQRQQPGAAQTPAPAQRGRQEVPVKKSVPIQTPPQQRAPALKEQRQQPGAAQRTQQAPRLQGQEQKPQDKGKSQEPKQGQGQGQKKDEERGRERNN